MPMGFHQNNCVLPMPVGAPSRMPPRPRRVMRGCGWSRILRGFSIERYSAQRSKKNTIPPFLGLPHAKISRCILIGILIAGNQIAPVKVPFYEPPKFRCCAAFFVSRRLGVIFLCPHYTLFLPGVTRGPRRPRGRVREGHGQPGWGHHLWPRASPFLSPAQRKKG